MEQQEELVSVLNDLIKINNDRVVGYEKAIGDTKPSDTDMVVTFNQMIDQSRTYLNELTAKVMEMGGDPAADTTLSGKVYRVWMDLKSAVSGKDRESVLGLCEFGEDAAQKAYDVALASDAYMSAEIRQMIASQKENLRTSHDLIKKYRDSQG